MKLGYLSDAIENEVQADVVAAKYSISALTTRDLKVVSNKSLLASTTAHHLVYRDNIVTNTSLNRRANTALDQARWNVRRGLGQSDYYSFQSRSVAGIHLIHEEFKLTARTVDGTEHFNEDVTFCTGAGFCGKSLAIRSWNHFTRCFRLRKDGFILQARSIVNQHLMKQSHSTRTQLGFWAGHDDIGNTL